MVIIIPPCPVDLVLSPSDFRHFRKGLSPPCEISIGSHLHRYLVMYHLRSETLALDLSLSRSNGGGGVGIDKVAAVLAVLELGSLGRADAHTAGVGTAARGAVGIVDAPARDKLGTVALADVAGAGVVGRDLSQGGDGKGQDGGGANANHVDSR